MEDRTDGADNCPYLNEEVLDSKWKKEVIDTGALVVGGQKENITT